MLFFRLWSLQVLSGDTYLAAAQGNQLRTIRIEAPRGTILDRNGKPIVDNVAGTAVKLWVGDLPKQGRYDVIKRLAWVLKVPARLAKEVDERIADPLNPITVKTAVGEDQVAYLYEHQAEFPGVQIQQTYLRHYPHQTLAAQVLGYVGEVSQDELDRRPKLYRSGDKVGKAGVEAKFDEYLRGEAGQAQIRVDSLGRPQGPLEPKREARPGHAVRLTIDIGLQRAPSARSGTGSRPRGRTSRGTRTAARSSRSTRATARCSRWPRRRRTSRRSTSAASTRRRSSRSSTTRRAEGELPGHQPRDHRRLPARLDVEAGRRARGDAGAPARAVPVDRLHADRDVRPRRAGVRQLGPVRQPRDDAARGARALVRHVLLRGRVPLLPRRRQGPDADAGVGAPVRLRRAGRHRRRPRGVGLVPTPAWRKRTFTSDWDKAWNPGDSIQLAIGQKDVAVTPLQMARFYAMIANGGKLVKPYVVSQVETSAARGQAPVVERRFTPDPPESVGVDPAALQVIRDGLYAATHSTYGTSSGVFSSFPIAVAGKTGTAEKVVPIPGYPPGHLEDQSWWCGYGPAQTEVARIVVCAVIENGGHGSTAAAPGGAPRVREVLRRRRPRPRRSWRPTDGAAGTA